MLKTTLALGLMLSSLASHGSLSDYEKGKCDVLNYRAEEICVELVCGEADASTIRDCKRSGDFANVMRSCHPQIASETIRAYNQRSTERPLDCRGTSYKPKF